MGIWCFSWTIYDRMWNWSSLLSNMDYNCIDFLFFIFFICINRLEKYRFTYVLWYAWIREQHVIEWWKRYMLYIIWLLFSQCWWNKNHIGGVIVLATCVVVDSRDRRFKPRSCPQWDLNFLKYVYVSDFIVSDCCLTIVRQEQVVRWISSLCIWPTRLAEFLRFLNKFQRFMVCLNKWATCNWMMKTIYAIYYMIIIFTNMDYNCIDFLFFIFFICINWLEK
jgi:hypothetical protein